MKIRYSTAFRQASGDVIGTMVDSGTGAGYVEFRTGTQPATGDDVASGTLLGTLDFAATSFAATNASGQTTANTVSPDVDADNSGEVTWARIYDGDGGTVVDVDVTETGGGGFFIVADATIVAGGQINIVSMSFTVPAGVG